MREKSKYLPYLALTCGILALSFSSLFVRWAVGAPGAVASFYRMAIGSIVFLPFFLRQPAAQRKINWRWFILPLLGGIFTAGDHAIWATAINYTRVANAILLNNLASLWVALVALIFWRERLTGIFWLGLAMAISGAAVVIGSDFFLHPQLNTGNLLGVISSFFYAAYFLATQRGREHFSTLTYVFLITSISSVILLGVNLGVGNPLTGFPPTTYLAFLGGGVVAQVIGYFSVGYALGHLPASVVSPTMIAQPILTALLAIPLAGEPLVPALWIGGLVVLAGIYLINRSRDRMARNLEPQEAPESG
jgi:drug/metabolite transporter (DMT)-like permease